MTALEVLEARMKSLKSAMRNGKKTLDDLAARRQAMTEALLKIQGGLEELEMQRKVLLAENKAGTPPSEGE